MLFLSELPTPCHRPKNYNGKACMHEPDPLAEHAECAGSAIYRANLGRAELMPKTLLRLPADKESCFASHAEFLAHHTGLAIEVAESLLQETMTPDMLLQRELLDQQMVLLRKE